MSEPDLITRIQHVLRKMSLIQDGGVTTTEVKVSSSHDSPILSFRGAPLSVEWYERFERLTTAAERDLEEWIKRSPDAGRNSAGQLRSRIRTYKGRDAVWVAFVERCSVALVEKVRRAAGMNAKTGLALETPLTAPPVVSNE